MISDIILSSSSDTLYGSRNNLVGRDFKANKSLFQCKALVVLFASTSYSWNLQYPYLYQSHSQGINLSAFPPPLIWFTVSLPIQIHFQGDYISQPHVPDLCTPCFSGCHTSFHVLSLSLKLQSDLLPEVLYICYLPFSPLFSETDLHIGTVLYIHLIPEAL